MLPRSLGHEAAHGKRTRRRPRRCAHRTVAIAPQKVRWDACLFGTASRSAAHGLQRTTSTSGSKQQETDVSEDVVDQFGANLGQTGAGFGRSQTDLLISLSGDKP